MVSSSAHAARGSVGLNILLASLGTVVGVVLFGAGYLLLVGDSGTHFESVSELHQAMLTEESTEDSGGSVSLRSLIYPHHDKRIIYTLRPGLEVRFQGVPVRTNSCGFRGEEVTLRKAAETFRIALLGDSFAFGWGVEEEHSFAEVLERELGERVPSSQVEVVNFGVPGYSTFQQAALFEENGRHLGFDAVLIYFVENDFGLPFFLGNPQRENALMTAVQFATDVWESDKPEHQRERAFFYEVLDPNKVIRVLNRRLAKDGIPLFLAINPGLRAKETKRRLTVLGKRPEVRLIPLREPITERIKKEGIEAASLSLPDDPHPSALKHRILGELLADGMEEEVRRSVGF